MSEIFRRTAETLHVSECTGRTNPWGHSQFSSFLTCKKLPWALMLTDNELFRLLAPEHVFHSWVKRYPTVPLNEEVGLIVQMGAKWLCLIEGRMDLKSFWRSLNHKSWIMKPIYKVLMLMCDIHDLSLQHQGGPNMQNRYSIPLIIIWNLFRSIFPNQKNGLSESWHFSLRLNV